MKRILLLSVTLFFVTLTFAQVDSSFFEQINGKWYSVNVDYDSEGTLLDRSVKIVGTTGDSAEVVNKSFVDPINASSSWAGAVASSINGKRQVVELVSEYGGLWTTITGGNYNIARSEQFASTYLFGQDSVKVRIFLFRESYADFWLFQLGNGVLRLAGIDNPTTTEVDESTYTHNLIPYSGNSFVCQLPASNDALVTKRLEELKATNAGITTEIDQLITELSSTLNQAVYFAFTEERIVPGPNGTTRTLPIFRNMEGTAVAAFITE